MPLPVGHENKSYMLEGQAPDGEEEYRTLGETSCSSNPNAILHANARDNLDRSKSAAPRSAAAAEVWRGR